MCEGWWWLGCTTQDHHLTEGPKWTGALWRPMHSGGETVGLVCSADGPGLSSPPAAAAAAAARHLQAGMALEDDGDW